jgi:hypothetical protein
MITQPTQDFASILNAVWPVFVGSLGFVVWLVRLEGKVAHNEKMNTNTQQDVNDLRTRHELLDSRLVEQLAQVRESLARIEGAIGVKNKEK